MVFFCTVLILSIAIVTYLIMSSRSKLSSKNNRDENKVYNSYDVGEKDVHVNVDPQPVNSEDYSYSCIELCEECRSRGYENCDKTCNECS